MFYGIPEQTNNTPQPQNVDWGNTINTGINALSNAFIAWVGAKYGTAAQQQVINNPTSDQTLQYLQLYQMMQGNKQQESDDTMKYIAFAAIGLAVVMMLTSDNKKRR